MSADSPVICHVCYEKGERDPCFHVLDVILRAKKALTTERDELKATLVEAEEDWRLISRNQVKEGLQLTEALLEIQEQNKELVALLRDIASTGSVHGKEIADRIKASLVKHPEKP